VSVILEGEALLNDASALLIYRLAVTAVLARGSIGADAIAPTFLLSLFGSVLAGLGLAWVSGHVTRRIQDVPSSIIVQFVSTYGVWVLADRTGLSPILTMVSYAMTLARSAPAYLPARLRIPSYAVWETAVLVLNVLAFLIIGLELGPIIAAARPGDLGRWIWLGAAVLGTVIGVRLLWTLAGRCGLNGALGAALPRQVTARCRTGKRDSSSAGPARAASLPSRRPWRCRRDFRSAGCCCSLPLR
jgi:monovalent cation/hydrogen antiporter